MSDTRKAIQVSIAETGAIFMTRKVWSDDQGRYINKVIEGRPDAKPVTLGELVDVVLRMQKERAP